MHVLYGRHCHAGTQIDNRASGVRPVSERPLIRTLAKQVQLQLRHPSRSGLVAYTQTHRSGVARPEVIARLVLALRDGRLELAIDKSVEVLGNGLIIVGANDDVGAAGPDLQARIQRRPRVRTGTEVHASSKLAGWNFNSEL